MEGKQVKKVLELAEKINELERNPLFAKTKETQYAFDFMKSVVERFREEPSTLNLAKIHDSTANLMQRVWDVNKRRILGLDLLQGAPLPRGEFEEELKRQETMKQVLLKTTQPIAKYSWRIISRSKDYKQKLKEINDFWRYAKTSKVWIHPADAAVLSESVDDVKARLESLETGGLGEAVKEKDGTIRVRPILSYAQRYPKISYRFISPLLEAKANVAFHVHPSTVERFTGPSMEDLKAARATRIPEFIVDVDAAGKLSVWWGEHRPRKYLQMKEISVGRPKLKKR
jgi:hypothetical protein